MTYQEEKEKTIAMAQQITEATLLDFFVRELETLLKSATKIRKQSHETNN